MDSYLFYDTETTGLSRCFDQVIQFAAIRTDLEFNEVERHEVLVQLRPDVVPAPRAFLTHHIPPNRCQQGVPEAEAIHAIHGLLNRPGTVSLGYNTLGFDDELLRFSFYRNLLNPYSHQYANGCGRMDLYPITAACYLFNQEILDWPRIDGTVSFKLEQLSMANTLAEGQAHDAMTDVEATLELARRLSTDQTVWNYLTGYSRRQEASRRIDQLTPWSDGRPGPGGANRLGLLVDGRFGAEANYITPVLGLGPHHHYRNQTLWLRLDQPALAEAGAETIADAAWVLNIKPGESEILLPILDRYSHLMPEPRSEICRTNLARLAAEPQLLQEIRHYHQDFTWPVIPHLDADANLYQAGFFSDQELALGAELHAAPPAQKSGVAHLLPPGNSRILAQRLVARNYPESAEPDDLTILNRRIEALATDPAPADYRGNPQRSAAAVLAEIRQLQQGEQTPGDQTILDELASHLQNYLLV
ncbi:MAG: exodeoxyribonuclease I [Gammaproteobacteria bacterium]|nr:exodeoxyribonuclease I [Gammaproteobacteria bacterium]